MSPRALLREVHRRDQRDAARAARRGAPATFVTFITWNQPRRGSFRPRMTRHGEPDDPDLGAVAVPEIQRTIVIGIVFPKNGQQVNAFDLPMPSDWIAER